MTVEKISPDGQDSEALTYGKNCKRCNVYFLTRNRMDDRCPWCKQVEIGQGRELAAAMADDMTFEEF
jgi:predicted Zn-ribbon and HTH transcriptional regulator